MFVLDASVYVASVSEADRHHEVSAGWLRQTLDRKHHLVAPNLLAIEVAAAVRRLTGSTTVATRIVSRMHRAEFIDFLPLTEQRATRASEVAARTGVRGADAVYLALARELGFTLVTFDRQQQRRGSEVATVRAPWIDA